MSQEYLCWVVEFRSGTYWAPCVEETYRGVGLGAAEAFDSPEAAERVAEQWLLAGATVVAMRCTR